MPTNEKQRCEICGCTRFTSVASKFEVSKCSGCGHISAITFEQASAGDLYEEEFVAATKHPTYSFNGVDYMPRAMEKWSPLLDRLAAFRTHGRILDIGCSTGVLLNEAKKRGWTPYGVEVSPFAAKIAREKFGITMHEGMLTETTYNVGYFDAVICSHVLEHVPSATHLLSLIHRILRPGGVLLLLIPTQFSSLSFKLGGRIRGQGPPIHVQFFNRKNLLRLMRQSGYVIESWDVNTQLIYLVSSATHSKSLVDSLEQSSEEIVNEPPKGFTKNLRNAGVKSVKAIVNTAGRIFDYGDEITVLARKKE
jgi:SAM-dependent methyltransferase